jgi:2-iminobutanoate/2-iminopropanoate deaminase
MKMQTIRSPKVAEAPPQTWSNMKVYNGHFHVAGSTAGGPDAPHPGDDMYVQAKRTFQKIKDMIEAAGGKMDDVMTMTIFVTKLSENTEVWRARREFFTGDYPCSTLVEVTAVGSPKMNPPLKVEIQVSGYIGSSG